jgi:hypothetical protein
MANFTNTFFALCPSPSTAVTAQPKYFHIDFRVIYQTIVEEIIQHYAQIAGLENIQRSRYNWNAWTRLPGELVGDNGIIPQPIQHDLLALALLLGINHNPSVNPVDQRDIFHMFFNPRRVGIKLAGQRQIPLDSELLFFWFYSYTYLN